MKWIQLQASSWQNWSTWTLEEARSHNQPYTAISKRACAGSGGGAQVELHSQPGQKSFLTRSASRATHKRSTSNPPGSHLLLAVEWRELPKVFPTHHTNQTSMVSTINMWQEVGATYTISMSEPSRALKSPLTPKGQSGPKRPVSFLGRPLWMHSIFGIFETFYGCRYGW
jgi:hypothetical protein